MPRSVRLPASRLLPEAFFVYRNRRALSCLAPAAIQALSSGHTNAQQALHHCWTPRNSPLWTTVGLEPPPVDRTPGANASGHFEPLVVGQQQPASKAGVERKLEAMKEFTAFAQEARRRAEGTVFHGFVQQQLASRSPNDLPALRSLFAMLAGLQEAHLSGASRDAAQQVVAELEKGHSFWTLRQRTLPKISAILGGAALPAVAWATPKGTVPAAAVPPPLAAAAGEGSGAPRSCCVM